MNKTYVQTNEKAKSERKWLLIDAEGLILGRLASEVASILRGKKKPVFTPNVDCGDYVIIINAEKVNVTGNKMEDKIYYRTSGYSGGLKTRNLKTMLELQPEKVLEKAIKGMLPKGPLGSDMYRKLFVYVGPNHDQQAQKPVVYKIDEGDKK